MQTATHLADTAPIPKLLQEVRINCFCAALRFFRGSSPPLHVCSSKRMIDDRNLRRMHYSHGLSQWMLDSINFWIELINCWLRMYVTTHILFGHVNTFRKGSHDIVSFRSNLCLFGLFFDFYQSEGIHRAESINLVHRYNNLYNNFRFLFLIVCY